MYVYNMYILFVLFVFVSYFVGEGLLVAAAEGVNIPVEEADHILQKVIDSR